MVEVRTAVGERAAVLGIRHAVAVDVGVAGVAEAVVVGVLLVAVRHALAVVGVVHHVVVVGVVVVQTDHAAVARIGHVQPASGAERGGGGMRELAIARARAAESIYERAVLVGGSEHLQAAVPRVDH